MKTSKKILIQAMTEEQPYGFKVEDDKITDLGTAPFGVKNIDTKVSLKLESAAKAIALDENGYATDKAVDVDGSMIQLTGDSIYHIIQR